jgi:hypothetical protein
MEQTLPVNQYSISWGIQTNTGTIYLHFTNGQQIQIPVSSAEVLSTLAGILRSSPTIFYQPVGEVLIKGVSSPGS